MLETFIGLILMIIPLFLALFFKDRLKGFLTVIAGIITLHLFLSIFTQALHIFSYELIIFVHSVIALVVLTILFIRRNRFAKLNFNINWIAIFALLIVGFQFWSAHYSYTGTISAFNGYQEVTNNAYIYPYYSDEWVGVSLINYSIENKSLPLVNPLWPDDRFPNPTFPFFSFFSEMFLLLQLNPLVVYSILAILSGTLICFLSYLILRKMNVGVPASLLATLSIPYIISGANLPGLWYFIPLIAGLIFLLFSLLSLVSSHKNLCFLYSILSIIFYPPIIVFALPIMIVCSLENKELKNNTGIFISFVSLIGVFVIASLFIFPDVHPLSLKDSIVSLVFRTNLQGGIPRFDIFTIIPIWILFFSLFGLWNQIKIRRYYLILPVIIGLTFWIIYSGTQKVFIIEYQRVIIVTLIFISLLAGLGFQYLKNLFCEKYQIYNKNVDTILAVLILIIFAIASPFYTRYTDWQKLVMRIGSGEDQIEISPSSPANIYLAPDDLKLFKNIRGERFIAPPWKGLVVGVATGNYPLESKASTITNHFLFYNNFLFVNCSKKVELAQRFNMAYAYSLPFFCPHFIEVGKSSEGLTLYKFED